MYATAKSYNTQNNLEKRTKNEGLRLPDLKNYYTASVIKKMCFWHQDGLID